VTIFHEAAKRHEDTNNLLVQETFVPSWIFVSS